MLAFRAALVLVAESGVSSAVAARRPLVAVASLAMEHRLQAHGLQEPLPWAQQLCTGSAALPRVDPSWTRDRAGVCPVLSACMARWNLNCSAPEEDCILFSLVACRSLSSV